MYRTMRNMKDGQQMSDMIDDAKLPDGRQAQPPAEENAMQEPAAHNAVGQRSLEEFRPKRGEAR